MKLGGKSRYWVGRREPGGPLLLVDLDRPVPPTLDFVYCYEVDLIRGHVKRATDVDALAPGKWTEAGDPEQVRMALKHYHEWVAHQNEAQRIATNEGKARNDAARLRMAERAAALRELEILRGWSKPMNRLVRLRAVPRADLAFLISWCDFKVQPELHSWLNASGALVPRIPDLSKRATTELTRVCAARAAEMGAFDWFHAHGYAVEDVAGQQLANSVSDWTTHDLLVTPLFDCKLSSNSSDGVPVDVKNARRTANRSGLATRLSVRRLKSAHGSHVKLLGIISPYLKLVDLLQEESLGAEVNHACVLGWTDAVRLSQLEEQFSDARVRFVQAKSTGLMLAPWLFERIPTSTANDSSINDWDDAFLALVARAELSPLQVAAIYSAVSRVMPHGVSDVPGARVLEVLVEKCSVYGFTLPVLYMSIIRLFLNCTSDPLAAFDVGEVRTCLYLFEEQSTVAPSGEEAQDPTIDGPLYLFYPLGVFDPLCTIAKLVSALDRLWRAARSRLAEYANFELYGTGLLRGVRAANGRRETVLAHCGGISSFGPCGQFPLLLGVHKHCANGLLICPRCGYCCREHNSP